VIATSFTHRATEVGQLLATRPLIHAVNFHATPQTRAAEYIRQLEHLSRHFTAVNEQDLDAYLMSGRWHKPKPGVILALYEGYRDHYDVFLPLLRRFGLIGWFFVITEFVKATPAQQVAFAAGHDITTVPNEYTDGRVAMSWDELRQIDQSHVVASHARSHTQLSILDTAAMESEVLGSQGDFKLFLGHPVRTFVSYGGPAYGENATVDRWINAAGYQFVFSNFQIQRLRSWQPR
jgi:peptidoglycan/xylan/chitin deacetylase (PgdA/CDA1 family)